MAKNLKATLSKDEVAEIEEAFKEIDIDGNGTIAAEELRNIIGEMLPEVVVDIMAVMADTNGDGKIDFEEFLQMSING